VAGHLFDEEWEEEKSKKVRVSEVQNQREDFSP